MIYRPPREEDFAAMQALDLELLSAADQGFAELPERERTGRLRTSLGSLRFFARSEHSFVAAELEPPVPLYGFVLAQSVWQGDRPIVLVAALRVHQDAPAGTVPGLLHACVKSAYDAAVYEVHLAAGPELRAAAEREGFLDAGERHLVRHLGSRGETAATPR